MVSLHSADCWTRTWSPQGVFHHLRLVVVRPHFTGVKPQLWCSCNILMHNHHPAFIPFLPLFQIYHKVGVKEGDLSPPTYVYPKEVKLLLRSVFPKNICDYPEPCHGQASVSSYCYGCEIPSDDQ